MTYQSIAHDAPTKPVHHLRQGDTVIHAGTRERMTVIDSERLGHGQWRVTFAVIGTEITRTHDLPGDHDMYTATTHGGTCTGTMYPTEDGWEICPRCGTGRPINR